jgi:hypothetical protein
MGPTTGALAFVVVERRPATPVRLFAPLRDKITSSARLVDLCWSLRASFDHLIGAGKQRLWYSETERLRGLEVDHELQLGGKLNR